MADDEITRRLDRTNDRLKDLEIDAAVSKEQSRTIIKRLDKIDTNIRWGMLIIVGGFLGGLVKWVVEGGLNGTP